MLKPSQIVRERYKALAHGDTLDIIRFPRIAIDCILEVLDEQFANSQAKE